MNLRRCMMIAVCAAAAAALWPAGWQPRAAAQSVDADRVSKIKAAYLLNFIRYTEWPAERFTGDAAPIEITILGEQPMRGVMEEAVNRSEPIGGRPVMLRRVSMPRRGADGQYDPESYRHFLDRLRQGHLLFIPDSERAVMRELIEAVDAADVLTVSDAPGFAASGGMLGLSLEENRIVFEANAEVIERSSLKVSAKVLRLARIVKTREDR